jgi:PIN domain nuclease of toxin-antitoxin system
VDEWTGSFTSEYQGFLTDTIIEDEAELFLNSGHYSSSLGDAMPLAMANVLRLPILIPTKILYHLRQFTLRITLNV